MDLLIRDGLPFVSASIEYGGKSAYIPDVLIDTGSAGSIFSVDLLLEIGLIPEPNDLVRRISGVGGSEFVFSKQISKIKVGEISLSQFEIEVGAMHYGFEMNGIIGMDFLTQAEAIIDLKAKVLRHR